MSADQYAQAAKAPPPLSRHGSCLCGEITYEVVGEPFAASVCHCVNCKKTSGTICSWEVFFKNEHLRITDGQNLLRTYHDKATLGGSALLRSFCSNCGGSMFLVVPRYEGVTLVNAGTVDNCHLLSGAWKPTKEVFCRNRVQWLAEFEGTQTFSTAP